MSTLETLLRLAIVVLLLHWLTTALLLRFLAVRVRLVNPLLLKLSYVTFTNKDVQLTCRSMKLRPQFGPNYIPTFSFQLEGVEIVLIKDPDEKESNCITPEEEVDGIETDLQALEQKYILTDLDEPLSLYSNFNKKLQNYLGVLIKLIPTIVLSAASITINFHGTILHLNNLKVRLHSKKVREKTLGDNSARGDNQKLLEWNAEVGTHGFSVNGDTVLSKLKFQSRCKMDLVSGCVSDILMELALDDVTIPILQFLSVYKELENYKKSSRDSITIDVQPSPDLKRFQLKRRLYYQSLIFKVFKKATVSINNLSITTIPILTPSEVNELLSKPTLEDLPPRSIFAHINVDTFEFGINRIFDNQAGFDLDFDKSDRPYHTSVGILGLKLTLDLDRYQNLEWKIKRHEIITITGLTLSLKSDLFFQYVQMIMSDTNDQKDSLSVGLINLNSIITGLILDLSCEQLAILISKFKDISNELTIRKLDKRVDLHLDQNKKNTKNHSKFDSFLGKIRTVLPRIYVKLLVEKPFIIIKHLNPVQNIKHILLLNPSLINFDFKGVAAFKQKLEKFVIESDIDISSISLVYTRRAYDIHQGTERKIQSVHENIVDSRNIQLNGSFQMFPFPLLKAQVDTESFKLKLTNLMTVKGVETIVTNIIERVNPRKDLNELKEKYASIIKLPQQKEDLTTILFNDLPPWIHSFNVQFRNISLRLMARSIFMPRDMVASYDLTDNDTINGNFRQILVGFESWKVTLKNKKYSKAKDNANDDDNSLFDSSSSTDTSLNDFFWNFAFIASKTYVKLIYEMESKKGDNSYRLAPVKLLDIPSLNMFVGARDNRMNKRLKSSKQNRIIAKLDVDVINMNYSTTAQFLLFSCLFFFKNTILRPVLSTTRTKQSDTIKDSRSAKLLDVVEFDCNIAETMIIFALPNDVSLRLDVLHLEVMVLPNKTIDTIFKVARLNVRSPTVPNFWTRLLTLDRNSISVDIRKNRKHDDFKVSIHNHDIRITVPNEYVVYHIFGSIGIFVKLIKQMMYNLSNDRQKTVVYPSEKKPVKLPRIELKSKRTVFSLEDDPFEVELGMIYQLGLVQQRARMEKARELERYINHACNNENISDGIKTKLRSLVLESVHSFNHSKEAKGQKVKHKISSTLLNSSKTDSHNNSSSAEEKIVSELERKAYILKSNISKSWISLIRDFKAKKRDILAQNISFLRGISYNSPISEVFNSDVLGYSENPPLIGIYLMNMHASVGLPSFGLEKLPEYMYKLGKGIPVDTSYSTLVPMHIELHAREARVHLRDYPLPLVFIPQPSSKFDAKAPCLQIGGDLVICEQYSDSDEQLKWNHIPFFDSCSAEGEFAQAGKDYYSFEVPSTLMPVKMISELEANICTDGPTKVTWGASYAAVLRQISMSFDSFSKPTTDISAKLGMWDKTRSIIHGKVRLTSTNNGELRINIKGSMDPYKLLGYSSGFALCFKKSLEVFVNKSDDSKDFLVFNADEVLFVIPNHFSEVLPVWNSDVPLFLARNINKDESLQSEDINTAFDKETLLSTSLYGIYLNSEHHMTDDDQEMIDIASERWCNKINVRLKGSILFKVSFLFERNCPDKPNERTTESIPHYEIKLKNPKYVKDNEDYDAYRGFRSNYIHMAFELHTRTPKEDLQTSINALYISPESLVHFFKWWKLFGNGLSLPIRRGKIFGDSRSSISFENYLFTNKFLFLVQPLNLFFGYRLDTNDVDDISAVGLKGKIDKFSVDLHQRKQLMTKRNEKLNKTIDIMKMQMYLGEIIFDNIDIRGIESTFDSTKMSTAHSYPAMDDVHSSNLSITNFKVFDDDMSWFDDLDFEELGLPIVYGVPSSCQCYPVLFSPRITYNRRTDDKDYAQYDPFLPERNDIVPFGNEPSHRCIISDTAKDAGGDKKEAEDGKKEEEEEKEEKEEEEVKEEKEREEDTNEGAKNIANFDNTFVLESILLKWNVDVRNFTKKFIDEIVFRRSRVYHNYKSIALIEKSYQKQDNSGNSEERKDEDANAPESKPVFTMPLMSCDDHVHNFSEELRRIAYKFKDSVLVTRDEFLVKLKSPQIQMVTDEQSEYCMLLTTPSINLEIISVKATDSSSAEKSKFQSDIESTQKIKPHHSSTKSLTEPTVEDRFGSFLKDTNLYVVYKKDVMSKDGSLYQWIDDSNYGSLEKWPPFLPYEKDDEEYDKVLKKFQIVSDTSMALRYQSYSDIMTDSKNSLILDVSEFNIDLDSSQYFAFYSILFNLLMNGQDKAQDGDSEGKSVGLSTTRTEKLNEILEKLALVTDFDNISTVINKVKNILDISPTLTLIEEDLGTRRSLWDSVDAQVDSMVRKLRSKLFTELYLILKTVISGNESNNGATLEMLVRADKIKVNMLESYQVPLIELRISNGVFKRLHNEDGSNDNLLQVQSITALNYDDNVLYPELLSGFEDPKPYKSKDAGRKLSIGFIEEEEENDNEDSQNDIESPTIKEEVSMVNVSWSMGKTVGGIRVVKGFSLLCEPLKVSFEQKTGEKILSYLFPDGKMPVADGPVIKSQLERDNSSFQFSHGGEKNVSDEDEEGEDDEEEEEEGGDEDEEDDDEEENNRTTDYNADEISLTGDLNSNRELDEMVNRASNYFSISSVKLNAVVLCISFYGTGMTRLINVTDFVLRLPTLTVKNKLWTVAELIDVLKKFLIKALLKHSGSLLGNKLKIRRKKARVSIRNKLKKKRDTFRILQGKKESD